VSKDLKSAPAPELVRELHEVVGRARKGDATAVPRLRELLAQYPELAEPCGNLAIQAEAAWATLIAGPDLYFREGLMRKAALMRAELSGPSPSPIERLLVERVVAAWLQLHYFDAVEPKEILHDASPKLMQYRARRQEQAHRAYLSSLAALTTLRRLLPPPITPITSPTAVEVVPATAVQTISATATEVVTAADSNVGSKSERNGHQRNGHSGHLSPGGPNRLTGYFEKPSEGTARRRKRKETCLVGN
jgi:hypothetical protein